VVVAVLLVVLLASGGGKPSASVADAASAARVERTLSGIPQSGLTLGDPTAPVTVTEFGDLICSACGRFALTSERQLISNDVRSGRVKLVYHGFMSGETANIAQFAESQIAARAAGLQKHAWDYVLLFYAEQRSASTAYVTDAYMRSLAKQIPGLNLAKWTADLNKRALAYAVIEDGQAAIAADVTSTPTIFVKGPKGTVRFSSKTSVMPSLAQLQALITRTG
jgi:protein-disulfide isomerase